MSYEFVVLLPPLIVVVLAGFTKNVRLSVGIALFIAGLIACNFSVVDALVLVAQRFWATTELGNLQSLQLIKSSFYLFICLFLLLLGIIIELVQISGGAYAYGNVIIKKLKSAQNAERASLLLSLLFAIDDYLSSLTVGAVMRPISDQFKIARVKLALLVNVLASPLAVVFPLSSWVAAIVAQLRQAGVSTGSEATVLIASDPASLYLHVIPFLFYSLIVIGSIWFVVQYRLSFGILAQHENVAAKTGNLFAGKIPVMRPVRKGRSNYDNASIWDFLVPILFLVVSVVGLTVYKGDYSNQSLIPSSLFYGSLLTIVVTIFMYLFKGRMTLADIPVVFRDGIKLMLSSVTVVLLIWTLSSILKTDLGTGAYLAGLISGHVPVVLLPVIFFFVAVVISATMGSAWGTFLTLIPIAVPMLASLSILVPPVDAMSLPLLLPLIGAIISGAVSGNHLSPIADVICMSASSAGAYHLDLVRAQVSFAVPAVISTGMAFLFAGLMVGYGYSSWLAVLVSLLSGLSMNCLLLTGYHFLSAKRLMR